MDSEQVSVVVLEVVVLGGKHLNTKILDWLSFSLVGWCNFLDVQILVKVEVSTERGLRET